jgi:RimJ/RimL family protein N-acetyltransferase
VTSYGRVSLRRVEPDDYPLIQGWQNDPEIFSRMDYQKPFTLEDIRRSEEHGAEKEYPFVIEVEGRPIGRCGLFGARWRDRWCGLYIFIGDKDSWGKGYAKDALRALLTYAFDTLNLTLVQLYSLGDNDRAVRLYKSLGFTEEARLRDRSFVEGRFVDHVVMSITRDEFRRSLES